MISDINEDIQIVEYISSILGHLRGRGIKVTTESDFRRLKSICENREDKAPLTAQFDPDRNDLLRGFAFWICGQAEDGEVVLLQALRLYELNDMSVAEMWRDHLPRIAGGGIVGTEHAPATLAMTGRVAYHGEMWSGRRRVSRGLSSIVGRMALALALLRWWPDHIYGFCPPRVDLAGIHLKTGYMHHDRDAIDWVEKPGTVRGDSWLIYNSRADLRRMIKESPATYF